MFICILANYYKVTPTSKNTTLSLMVILFKHVSTIDENPWLTQSDIALRNVIQQ